MGHEFMGEVVELGSAVKNLNRGDRVVVPFTISCGNCFFCQRDLWSLCDNSNPNAWMAEKLLGHSPSGLFGYSHLTGGYAGGQAEYARVPFADTGLFKIPDGLTDEQVLFLTDIFPTGYMAAENCEIQPGDTVAIWGCGPVGQFAIRSAYMLGAARVIAIDRVPERLEMARAGKAEVLNYDEVEVGEALKEMTGGRVPDSVMDAVGMEAHGAGLEGFYDKVKQAAVDTTSAATKADADQIKQRKENASHYPNWYEDQRSLESYMDRASVNKRGESPTDQNNDAGYNPIRQNRVNGYSQDKDQSGNLVSRSRDRLKDAASNVQETFNLNSSSSFRSDNRADASDIKDRAGNRIEQAKDTFQEATGRAVQDRNPIITGESNR